MNARYLTRQAGQAVFTVLMIVLLNFILFRMMPGSPERILLRNPALTPEVIQATRERWGLADPLLPIVIGTGPFPVSVTADNQLFAFIGSTLRGDLGYSLKFRGQPVAEVVGARLVPTVILIGLGQLIATIVGLALGAYAGWRRGGRADRIGNGLSLILYSTPYFVIGMPLVIIFAAGLGWFPTSGMFTIGAVHASLADQLIDYLRHLALPLATVSLGLIGGYSILMRSSIIETRSEDYIETARAKGLTDGRILRSHAFPNALLPTVSLIAINLGWVVAGAITAEVVFDWPGIGTLTVVAMVARDYPVLQGVFLLLGVTVVLANLLADIVYGFLDPRVRVSGIR